MLYSRGLVGSWRLENTALDGSGNGNHGTPVGNPTYVAGRIGRCLDFPNTLRTDRHYLDVTGLTDAGKSHTFAFRAYPRNSARSLQYIFDAYIGRLVIGWGGDTARLIGLYSSAAWGYFGASPPSNTWHDVAITTNATTSTATMFLGGIPYGLQVNYTPVTIGSLVHIGARYDVAGTTWAGFDGPIDEFHIWNRVLTETDIRRVMMGMHPIS